MHMRSCLLILFLLSHGAVRAEEARPVLRVRSGWTARLVAQAPEIRHPSVVCTAPDGRVFLAEDPMDIQEGMEASAREGRILCLFPDGSRKVFADNLHAVFGMQYLEGQLYVLHNPSLTVFRDENGVGQDPRDLLTHTLPEPWALGWNDHIPANFKLGMDGWFYLAVGDKGLQGCTGSDGKKLSLAGGGVVRFRPDGSGLEIFATGVRNILDTALNAEDECFTYDNTDEHQWMGRLTHMVESGTYGYPHDFIPRRPWTLWMMHDFGAGAACGTLCNTDDALPPEMEGNLLLADFGKRQVTRVRMEREGASYRMAGAEELFLDPPADFRPVGLGWSADGRSFYVCDWQYRDQKTKDQAGRLWQVEWTGESHAAPRPAWWTAMASGAKPAVPLAELLTALNHPARSVRLTAQRGLAANRCGLEKPALAAALQGAVTSLSPSLTHGTARLRTFARVHALWALNELDAQAAAGAAMEVCLGPDSLLAAQALRVLSQRRADRAAPAAASLLQHVEAPVRLQAATALGRFLKEDAATALLSSLASETDPVVRFAIFSALHRLATAHPTVLRALVDGLRSASAPLREGCWLALRNLYSESLVGMLGKILADPGASDATAEAALSLLGSVVHRLPDGPFVWWAYHPAKNPPPTPSEPWAGTAPALNALRLVLDHPNPLFRAKAAGYLGGARDTASASGLRHQLATDSSLPVRLAALQALSQLKDPESAKALAGLLDGGVPEKLRLAALLQLGTSLTPEAQTAVRRIAGDGTAAEKLAAVRALGQSPHVDHTTVLLSAAHDPALKDAAIRAMAAAPGLKALPLFVDALSQPDPALSQAAREAIRQLGSSALPGLAARADTLPDGIKGTLRNLFSDDPAALAHPLFSNLPLAAPADYEAYAKSHDGDPWRGQQIFFGSTGAACIGCHQVAGAGGLIGPDLTMAGQQFSRSELIASILYPSREVREGYRWSVISTSAGREQTGVVRADNADGITLADLTGQTTLIPRTEVRDRKELPQSLMPEGLHAALTHEQFADLVAYMTSRTSDPRRPIAPPPPEGFVPIFNGHDLAGWRLTDQNRTHWKVKDGVLEHDGLGGDLWSEQEWGDLELQVEWRWSGTPQLVEFPVIDASGQQLDRMEKVLDAGDSGIFLRGLYKAQANLFCYPVGSGEFWEYRESLTGDARRDVTPRERADAPVGDWNLMRLTLQGSRVTIHLNGKTIIREAALPDLPGRGPIGFQHEHGPLQIRHISIKAL